MTNLQLEELLDEIEGRVPPTTPPVSVLGITYPLRLSERDVLISELRRRMEREDALRALAGDDAAEFISTIIQQREALREENESLRQRESKLVGAAREVSDALNSLMVSFPVDKSIWRLKDKAEALRTALAEWDGKDDN